MYPNNTVLANLVKEFGDNVLIQFTSAFFSSHLFQFIIFVAGTIMFLFTAMSIHRKVLSKYIIYFWCGWICCIPFNGKPVIYILINTACTLLANEISKETHAFFASGKTVPPGFVFNSLMRASTTRITDPIVHKDVNFILDNCIPDVKNKNGFPLSAADLFGVDTHDLQSGSSSFGFNFDTKYLMNREFEIGSNKINCLELLKDTLVRMRTSIDQKRITDMPPNLYVGPNNGESIGPQMPVTTWDSSGSTVGWRVQQIATNLAQANSIQSLVLSDYFGVDVNNRQVPSSGPSEFSHGSSYGLDPSIVATRENMGRLSTGVLNTMGNWNSLFRSNNLDFFYDNAKKLNEMNEKLKILPYTVAFIQSLLKAILPFICISLFFGSFRFISFWASAWLITLMTPWFFYISRLFSNTLILYVNKIGHAGAVQVFSPAFLENGVNFEAATNMLADTSIAMNAFLNLELGIWASVMTVIPLASFFLGHGKAGAIGEKIKGGMENFAVRSAGNVALTTGTMAATKIASKIPFIGPAASAGVVFVAKAAGSSSAVNQFKDYFGKASTHSNQPSTAPSNNMNKGA